MIGWIFAHVFNVVAYEPEKVLEDPLILFKIWGSISSYGGLLGGIFAVFAWKWFYDAEKGKGLGIIFTWGRFGEVFAEFLGRTDKNYDGNFDLKLWADHAAWTIPFAWFFGRMGCASVHDHPGAIAPESWPLAINFPQYNSLGEVVGYVPRHDLGFYEMMWWAVIIAAVMILDRKPRPKGFFLGVVFMMYAPARFLLDFMRVWPRSEAGGIDVNAFVGFFLDLLQIQPEVYAYGGDARYLGLTPAQYVSMGIFLTGLIVFLKVRNNDPIKWKQYEREPR